MTPEKILGVIAVYRSYFKQIGVEPISYPHEEILDNTRHALGHCYGMLDQMESFVTEGRIEKTFRWLGFIQGVLWATHHMSLDHLKDHNRPSNT